MKIKYIILVIILIFLSGCNATYNVEINSDDGSTEILTIHNNKYSKGEINSIISEIFLSDADLSLQMIDNDLIIKRNNIDYHSLNNSYAIKEYFGSINISSDKISFVPDYDKCIFLFSDGGEYVSDDDIEINITLPFKIKKSNADKVNDKTYTWIYNINECKKEAYIEVNNYNIVKPIILIVISIILIITLVFIKKKFNF